MVRTAAKQPPSTGSDIHSQECTLASTRGKGCFAMPKACFHAVKFMHFLLLLKRLV